MATRTKKVNNWYMKYAEKEMVIDMDEQNNLYCDVPSETTEGKYHRVHVDESTVVPVAIHCSCSCFEHKGSCKHQIITNNFYARIYKSNLEKFIAKVESEQVEVKQAVAEAEQVSPVVEEVKYWDKDQACYCFVSTRKPVNPAEQEAKLKAQRETYEREMAQLHLSRRGSDIERKGSLNGAQQSAGFWESLPSRKTA